MLGLHAHSSLPDEWLWCSTLDYFLPQVRMESELLKVYKLTEGESDRKIADTHLEEISRTCSKEWRSLRPYLDLPDTTVSDIERDSQNEGDRRNNFFSSWKRKNGTRATYRKLVYALLKIGCRGDAEKVCELLLESRQKSSRSPVKSKPTQSIDEGITCIGIPNPQTGNSNYSGGGSI